VKGRLAAMKVSVVPYNTIDRTLTTNQSENVDITRKVAHEVNTGKRFFKLHYCLMNWTRKTTF